MKCFSCKEETQGMAHNDRGVFCTFCMARLPLTCPETEMVVVMEEPAHLPQIEPESENKEPVMKPRTKRQQRKRVTK